MEQSRRANQQFGLTDEHRSPWNATDGFQLGGPRRQQLGIDVDGERIDVTLAWPGSAGERSDANVEVHYAGGVSSMGIDSDPGERRGIVVTQDGVLVVRNGRQTRVALYDPFAVDLEHMDEGGSVKAPMHGKLVAVFVQPGDRVEKGQRLAIVEAMKMEHSLVAPSAGEVTEVAAEPGAQVAEGARLIVLKADD
jgi:3-methylcrotonyl-CoA carboxylase alpha subunit